jgi:murein DD-endopeptidase MepM/ murein hydrolase activator NlpD
MALTPADLIQQGALERTPSSSQDSETESVDMPFANPLPEGKVTSRFGNRMHPIYKVVRFHNGIDLKAPMGAKIFAAAAGKISWAEEDKAYGKKITISHANDFETVYAQLSKILVKKGQSVKKGELIALVGSSGISTGPHLHFELRRYGKPVNPESFVTGGFKEQ